MIFRVGLAERLIKVIQVLWVDAGHLIDGFTGTGTAGFAANNRDNHTFT